MKISQSAKLRSLILVSALLAGLSLVTDATAEERAYLIDLNSKTAIPLESIEGANTYPAALNDAGQVVGYYDKPGSDRHAFITGPDGVGNRDLGTLGGDYSEAHGINNAGQVVGGSRTAGGSFNPFITGPDGVGMRDLGTLGGSFGRAMAINDSGQVVGYSSLLGETSYSNAFITGPDGMGMRDLGTLGGRSSAAYDINNTGQVAGHSGTAESGSHAFITGPDGMGMRDLGTLGNAPYSEAFGINDDGQVVGDSYGSAFITGPDGVGMRNLGSFGTDAFPFEINNAGEVVGRYVKWDDESASWVDHAFVTGPDGKEMMDLNSVVNLPAGVTLIDAKDINNVGQVIAIASVIPVIPEPEIYAMLLAGLGLIGFMARRKKMAA